ncbi:MAG: glycosyltransferase [Cytophagales bacterium]
MFCSLLKPINDVRMHEKLAKSISVLQGYDIHLIGQNISTKNLNSNFTYHPISLNSKGITEKIKAYFKILFIIFRIKPFIFICTTHELLSIGFFLKHFLGTKLIYDIQENYPLNYLSSKRKLNIFHQILALMIKVHQNLFVYYYDHFILAEKCYLQQLKFIKIKPFTVLENKSIYSLIYKKKVDLKNVHVLFSGTISEEYGIFDAVNFVTKWHQHNPGVVLTIIGHVTRKKTFDDLYQRLKNLTWVNFKGQLNPVSYEDIIADIENCDVGLMAYKSLASFENKIPTKLFEYAAFGKFIISSAEGTWCNIITEKKLGICCNLSSVTDFMKIEEQLIKSENGNLNIEEFIWGEREKNQVIKIIISIVGQ